MVTEIHICYVVPAYNVERYIDECMASIIEAAADGDQVILVNDGSTDGTLQRCQAWAERHPALVTLVDQSNRGLSAARNAALRLAATSHVLFMDADDVVIGSTAKRAREVLQLHRPDILVLDFEWWYPHDANRRVRSPSCRHPRHAVITDTERFFQQTMEDALLSACSRIFSLRLLRSLGPEPFPTGRYSEEIATVPRLTMRAQSLYYLPQPLFLYRVRAGSITQAKSLKKCLDLAGALADTNQEARSMLRSQASIDASVVATACFAARALQDCGRVNGATPRDFNDIADAGLRATQLIPTEVLRVLKAANTNEATWAARHLSAASRHPRLYAASRRALALWKNLQSRS